MSTAALKVVDLPRYTAPLRSEINLSTSIATANFLDSFQDLMDSGWTWRDVHDVYTLGGQFYFSVQAGGTGTFNLFEYIQQHGGPSLCGATARQLVGAGYGPPPELSLTSALPPSPMPMPAPDPARVPSLSEMLPPLPQAQVEEDDEDEFETTIIDSNPESIDRLLHISSEKNVGLGENPCVLGRSKRANFQMSGNQGVSRTHAEIRMENDNLVIEDLGSSNGTYVNKIRILPNTPTVISSGDIVDLYNEEFQVL